MSGLSRRIAISVFLSLCLSAAGMSLCRVAQGQKNPALDGKKVTLNLRNSSFSATLKSLFHEVKTEYRIEPDVLEFTQGENRSLNWRGFSFKDALTTILWSYGANIYLGFHIEHGRYVIETHRVTLNAKNSLLHEEIATLFESSGVNFIYDRNALVKSKVTVFAKNISIVQAIKSLLAQAPTLKLRCEVVHGVFIIKPTQQIPTTHDKTLSLRLRHVHLQDAVAAILITCDCNYITSCYDELITEEAFDKPVSQALEDALAQAKKPLSYIYENGLVIIGDKTPPETDLAPP